MDEPGIESNGEIVVDCARSFKAEDVVEVYAVRGTMNVPEASGASKPDVMFVKVSVVQKTVSGIDVVDPVAT